mmetsp:Transcript_117000/g.364285  ORF Transcript_117000/g.364285 Transcript_117000/m.364285 type:complete len:348 (-) Transcript_117000:43-1086(-)
MQMVVMPGAVGAARGYPRVNGTMLVLIVQHGFPYAVNNVQHVLTSIFPTAQALEELDAAGDEGIRLSDISAVAAWQLRGVIARAYDVTARSMQLLGRDGFKPRLFTKEDVEGGVCADRLIRLGLEEKKYEPQHWFHGEAHRLHFRAKALSALGLPDRSLPDCKAVLVTREPPQGVANGYAIEQAMRRSLKEMNWGLKSFHSTDWQKEHAGRSVTFSDQVSLFHDASLSVMVHGAEAMNMVYQPPGAAHLIIVKCGDNGGLSMWYAYWLNITAFRSYPANCTIPPFVKRFNYTVNEQHYYYADFEKDILGSLKSATKMLEEKKVCVPRRNPMDASLRQRRMRRRPRSS